MLEKSEILKRAKKGKIDAQEQLYQQYSVMLYVLCLRYARDRSEANDILQEGFITIFKDLNQYNGKGDLAAWMRKVMVNTALQYIRKWKKDWNWENSEDHLLNLEVDESAHSNLNIEEMTKIIQQLPMGYRVVFNMYVIEGYSHKEIASKLDISESTSKSQLHRAKQAIRNKMEAFLLA